MLFNLEGRDQSIIIPFNPNINPLIFFLIKSSQAPLAGIHQIALKPWSPGGEAQAANCACDFLLPLLGLMAVLSASW